MKFKSTLAIICILLAGCSSNQIESSLPTIKTGAQVSTAFTITILKVPASQQVFIYDVVVAVNSVTGGNVAPTVAQLDAAMAQYLTTPGAQAVGSFVTSLYSQYYPKLSGNAKLATDFLQAVSAGVELATANNSAALAKMNTLPLNVRVAIWNEIHGAKP